MLNLRVANVGEKPTCVRMQESSLVDITWALANLIACVADWRMLPEEESLSDHLYIQFTLLASVPRLPGTTYPKWSLRTFNADFFAEVCEAIYW